MPRWARLLLGAFLVWVIIETVLFAILVIAR